MRIVEAFNGFEAIDQIEKNQDIDIVLMDKTVFIDACLATAGPLTISDSAESPTFSYFCWILRPEKS